MAKSRKKTVRKVTPKAKPKARSSAKRAASAGGSSGRFAASLHAFGYIGPGVVALAVVIGAVFGLPRLRESASYRMRYQDGVSIFVELPVDEAAGESGGKTWLKDEFATDLHRIAAEAISANPDVLSRKQLDMVRLAVARTGWFEGDPIVRRTRGQIHISGTWRVPAAVVRYGDLEYLISWRGNLLPKTYVAGEAYKTDGVRVITGVAFGPPADAQQRLTLGARWPGDEVRAALELLALLEEEAYAADVAGIDVSPRKAGGVRNGATDRQDLTLSIVTPDDTRVVWGCSPSVSGVYRGEVSREQKLANLRELYRRFGRIDAGRPMVEVFGHDVGFASPGGGP
jgi:hypothetical protein